MTDIATQEVIAVRCLLLSGSLEPLSPTCRPSFPEPRLLSFAGYLTCYPVWAELPEAQRGLDPPQQGHHIEVLDSAPVEDTETGISRNVTQSFLLWGRQRGKEARGKHFPV